MKVFRIKLRDKISNCWYYKVKTETGYKKFKGYTDKRSTEERQAKHQAEIDRGMEDIVNKFRSPNLKPLSSHLNDYLQERQGGGKDKTHNEIVKLRMLKMMDACQWNRLPDITVESFLRFRDTKIFGLSPKTRNDYQQIIRTFCRWCIRHGRMPIDPFQSLSLVKINGDIRRQRRAMTDQEVNNLLTVCNPQRRPMYMLALLTGLRRNEIRQLQWEDIHLDAVKPFLLARASTTKNGKQAVIFLRDDLVEALRELKTKTNIIRCPRIETFYKDLKTAGIARKDASGRIIDFHSLRHTLATNCALSNVPVRTAMEVMRHSSINLTTKTYTDAKLLPTADAIESLPRFNMDAADRPDTLKKSS